MIKVIKGEKLEINLKETLRYLGAGNQAGAEELFEECSRLVYGEQSLSACYGVFPLSFEGDTLNLGFARTQSRALLKNLSGCDKIVLFAATVGAGVDRLIRRYSALSPARAAVIQAMGSALAESWCDVLCAKFNEEFGETRPRFSCGYGDLPLTMQRDIFAALDPTGRLGINLSDDCFMTPTKSVTAIVGVLRK